jgi:putative flippase GtrA
VLDPAAARRIGELSRFAVTGLAAYAADVTVFNLALLALHLGSLPAKLLSSAVAIAVAFIGSRYYTWPAGARANPSRTVLAFVAISVAAALLQVAFLWFSHQVLGLTSALADNVSANVIGMGAATVLRFWAFRRFVFVPAGASAADHRTPRGATTEA